MKTFSFELSNDHGLHARPASLLIQTCSKFTSQISLIKNDQKFNCKSMLGILKMAGVKGDALTIEIEGADETEALNEVKALIASNFNE